MTTVETASSAPEVTSRFAHLEKRKGIEEYNFAHFTTLILLEDVKRTINKEGVSPGAMAPDFELPTAMGDSLRLSELRGRPVLLHFGSLS